MGPGLPLATEWFREREIDQGITLITEPHVHPFLRANIWHVRGGANDLLIDTGTGWGSLRTYVENQFGRTPIVVLTHSHVDHAGGAWEFDDVRGSPAEPFASASTGLVTSELAAQLGLAQRWTVDLPEILVDAVPAVDSDPWAFRSRSLKGVSRLEPEATIDLGSRALRVLALPGHTPGSVGLWDESTHHLFTGDALYDDELIDDLIDSDPVAYRHTMAKLAALEPEVVHCGHGRSLSPVEMRELCQRYLQRG